jgi:hypothetical protein
MLKRLSEGIKKEVGPNTPPPTPTDQDFNGIMTSIGEVFSEIKEVDKSELFKEVDSSLSNIQSKGK